MSGPERRRRRSKARWLRLLAVFAASLVAGVGTFATVAASLPESPTSRQLAWAVLASLIAAGFTYFQLRKQDSGPTPNASELQELRESGSPASTSAEATPRLQPFQLPPDIADFTGRDRELSLLRKLARARGDHERTMVVSAIGGKAGVGKTAFAVHAAHMLNTVFPDGQLYANLRGMSNEKLQPHDVLATFLRTLGIEEAAIPKSIEARTGLYRTLLRDRRIIVLLDNAADESQVRPLLPSGHQCLALITSRSLLAGLEAAHFINLEVLEPDEAVELLGKVAGTRRVRDEAVAAKRIVEQCGYLPLAVRIAGAKLAARRHWRLDRLVARLDDEKNRLAELEIGDHEIRATFALTYRDRSAREQRLFRLLGQLDMPDFPGWVAAALLDEDSLVSEDALEQLVDSQLLEAVDGQSSGIRYQFHDLIELFARERFADEDTPDHRRVALERVFGAYLLMADLADRQLPTELPKPDGQRARRWTPPELPLDHLDSATALEWFTGERTCLTAAVQQAFDLAAWDLTWELAACLTTFFDTRAYVFDWRRTHELALEAARRADVQVGEAFILRNLGRLYRELGRYGDAISSFEQCLPLYRRMDDALGEAHVLRSLGLVYRYQGRFDEALSCFDKCLGIFRHLGDALAESITLVRLGAVYREQGRLDRAVNSHDDALKSFRDLGHHHWEAIAGVHLGVAYREQGRIEEAFELFDMSLKTFDELGDRRWGAITRLHLGTSHGYRRDFSDAADCLERALVVFRTLGDRFGEARTLSSIGSVAAAQGLESAAEEAWRGALAIFRDLGAPDEQQIIEWLNNPSAWHESRAGVRGPETAGNFGAPEV